MARTVLTSKELESIDLEYGTMTDSTLAKKWHIGVPRLLKEMKAFTLKKQRASYFRREIAGTKLSTEEDKEIALLYTEEYLAMSTIAKQLFRSPTAIRNSLVRSNIPIRDNKNKTSNKLKISGDTESEIVIGNKVYSSKYNEYAIIVKDMGDSIYRIWVLEPKAISASAGYYAHQRRRDLFLIKKEV